ncbi:acetyltransferase [Sphingomonas sp. Leaf357]|uniref:GNAT family N-acetyltransferase n=1 Tax=Sphingomonas sp. Leaf357 TaxID=1736350 RepID=UPI0006F5EED9|nr:GNAT family N-acetyltransferase [Sphingomonas sp. Leaf357]KQS03252.1 acetyltransferase [Sphingomonas sp. Leaf357]
MPPVLHTERLILRPLSGEDLEDWVAFHADPVTMEFLGGVQERSAAWRGLCAMRGSWDIAGFAMFALIERSSGRWIGRVGPWQPDGWPGTEIGWGVARAFAGRGYAHEAAVATMDYAVDVLGWSDIIHTIHPDNAGSIALAKRLGSENRGPTRLPPPMGDFRVDAWGQSADAWRARRAGQSAR